MKMRTYTPEITQSRFDKLPLRSVWRLAFSFGASTRVRRASVSGFSLMEMVVSILMAGIMLPVLFIGLAFAFSGMQATRENCRVTQILVQRMEAIRLAPYNTLQNPTAYPTNSTEYYSPSGQPSGKGGAAYTVTYNWASAPSTLPPSYRTNMMLVTVSAAWKSGSVQHTRSMQSYVAKYGIQRYVSIN